MNRILIATFAAVVSTFALACTTETVEQPEVSSSAAETNAGTIENETEKYAKIDPALIAVVEEPTHLDQGDMIDPAKIGTRDLHRTAEAKPTAPAKTLLVIDPNANK